MAHRDSTWQAQGAGSESAARSDHRQDLAHQGQHTDQGGTPVPGHQTAVWPHQGALPGGGLKTRRSCTCCLRWPICEWCAGICKGSWHECVRDRRLGWQMPLSKPDSGVCAITRPTHHRPRTSGGDFYRQPLIVPDERRFGKFRVRVLVEPFTRRQAKFTLV